MTCILWNGTPEEKCKVFVALLITAFGLYIHYLEKSDSARSDMILYKSIEKRLDDLEEQLKKFSCILDYWHRRIIRRFDSIDAHLNNIERKVDYIYKRVCCISHVVNDYEEFEVYKNGINEDKGVEKEKEDNPVQDDNENQINLES